MSDTEAGVADPLDALHQSTSPHVQWTTNNFAEAIPGVLTPLTWSFWQDQLELGTRAAFCDIGVIPRSEIRLPESMDERFLAAFYGRACGNVDVVRAMAELMPGTSGDEAEAQFFGAEPPPGARRSGPKHRYPVVAAKLPLATARLPRRIRTLRQEGDGWWRRAIPATEPAPLPSLQATLVEAARRFERCMHLHVFASMIAQATYAQVAALARKAGRPGLETTLVRGYGALEETRVTVDLWEVSRDRLELAEFLARHGFHGPGEGELSNRTWREDRSTLDAVLGTFRTLPEEQAPAAVERRRAEERRAAETELVRSLGPAGRVAARPVLAAAKRYVPLREVGKTAFLQTIDVARAASRRLGEQLARDGLLADPEDVLFLTMAEVTAPLPDDAPARVAHRRAKRAEHEKVQLPNRWRGVPEPLRLGEPDERQAATAVRGLGVSAGVAEGRVRVVLDPEDADPLEPGEILVCETTDPSWAPFFLVASALVIDIGAALSHGAIVARELGVPCVINTQGGTSVLRTGDLVRVDGEAGTVEVLEPAPR